MRVALLATVVAFSASAFAGQALVFKDESLSIRLTQEPCTSPVADLLIPEVLPTVKRADVVFQGQAFRACWRSVGQFAEIVDETGDGGRVPMNLFKPDNGV